MIKEKLFLSKSGQWELKKWNLEKKCWEGYERVPGTKEGEKGSCRPKSKELKKAKDMSGDEVNSHMAVSQLESIQHHIEEIREHLSGEEIAPDWVKAKISEAANVLSDIAHFIMGLKQSKEK
jgi:hypothetical protein